MLSRLSASLLAAVVCLTALFRAFAAPAPDGASVLARYHAALTKLPPIGNLVFQYNESRIGPTRVIDEEHLVYRADSGEERNETIAVDGTPVVPALRRLSKSDAWPYDVRQFAVNEADYSMLYLGLTKVGGRPALGFSTVRSTVGDFAVTGIYLDPARYLPLRETFDTQGGGCRGSGLIDFGPVSGRWLPVTVTASCSVAPGTVTFKETIRFSDYRFPPVIPPDVFGVAQ